MKVCILICLLFTSLAFAQKVPPPDPDENQSLEPGSAEIKQTRCVLEVHIEGFFRTLTKVQCGGNDSACETQIEQRADNRGRIIFRSVRRGCTSLQACKNNAAGNFPKCFPGENNVRQCVFCCRPGEDVDGDLCNANIGILP